MKRTCISFVLSIIILIQTAQALALQFTASAVMSSPGGVEVTTNLYYSTGRIRKEFLFYGEPVIQILDANRHISLMCFAQQKICYQNESDEQINIGIENTMSSPCEGNPALTCENLGIEELNNRKATHWKVVAIDGDKKRESSYWLDTELKLPIKQLLFNGTTIELKWLGDEMLNNRSTHKWMQQIKLANGETVESFQWFDKELKISIKETFANGNSQELQRIEVKPLEDELFSMPSGFENKTSIVNSSQSESEPVQGK